ncbi:hypothetical protein Mal33_01290 [Rosistilla oblonga]|uniref:Uncharacterized protein n=1 Tax=Rosistilla oblonga TaxID=2527990 RepID=A0A518IM55_9BACT|nr:hypothetical protein Mal33_01290 [Rosistilla oblonga]
MWPTITRLSFQSELPMAAQQRRPIELKRRCGRQPPKGSNRKQPEYAVTDIEPTLPATHRLHLARCPGLLAYPRPNRPHQVRGSESERGTSGFCTKRYERSGWNAGMEDPQCCWSEAVGRRPYGSSPANREQCSSVSLRLWGHLKSLTRSRLIEHADGTSLRQSELMLKRCHCRAARLRGRRLPLVIYFII